MAHPIAPQQQAQGQARSNNVAPHKLIPRVHELPASIHAQPRQFLYRTESRASRFSPYRSFPSSVIDRLVNEAIQYNTICSNKKKVGWSGDRERERESVLFHNEVDSLVRGYGDRVTPRVARDASLCAAKSMRFCIGKLVREWKAQRRYSSVVVSHATNRFYRAKACLRATSNW